MAGKEFGDLVLSGTSEYVYLDGLIKLQNAQAVMECLKWCNFDEVDSTSIQLTFEALAALTLGGIQQVQAQAKNPTLEIINGRIEPIKKEVQQCK